MPPEAHGARLPEVLTDGHRVGHFPRRAHFGAIFRQPSSHCDGNSGEFVQTRILSLWECGLNSLALRAHRMHTGSRAHSGSAVFFRKAFFKISRPLTAHARATHRLARRSWTYTIAGQWARLHWQSHGAATSRASGWAGCFRRGRGRGPGSGPGAPRQANSTV